MLIDFTVTNFKSIKAPMTLSAETGERLRRLQESNTLLESGVRLLKSLLIVGANGSGKTTLIDALATMRQLVVRDRPRITDSLRYTPFRLATSTGDAPTEMVINFISGGVQYRYSLAYQLKHVTSEKLEFVKASKFVTYFDRVWQDFRVLPEHLHELKDSTKPNSLVLFNAQSMNDPVAIQVFRWFQTDLVFMDESDATISDLIDLVQNPAVKTEFLRFLRFADFNITDIKVRQVPLNVPASFLASFKKLSEERGEELDLTRDELYTVHKVYNDAGDVVDQGELPLRSESRGTQKIFAIVLSIIQAQLNGNGRTLFFDEFDDSLHLELSSALLQIFNSKQNGNQFVLTTHELQLLDDHLRTDQIYLMEKDFKGQSELKSVFDFQDARSTGRSDTSFMKRYIQGRFGALPQVSVSAMLAALSAVDQISSEAKG